MSGKMPGDKPPDEPSDREKKWRDRVDEQVRDAYSRGDFDNLRGKGKRLDLTGNPYAGDWEMAYNALANAGFAPEWVERDKEIRRRLDELTTMLERHVAWHNESVAEMARMRERQRELRRDVIEDAHEKIVARYRAKAAEVNKLITNFNLIVPIASLQRFKIDAEADLRKFDARLAPLPQD
ncbi:MAG: DnaJ family domain-containing protein [Anaerolineae bacterium]